MISQSTKPPEKLTAPLQSRTFRFLWASVLVSNVGSMIQGVGAGWLMATITHSENLVALVQSAISLPVMMFSLFAGALADSFERRRQMLVAQSSMFVISIIVALVTYAGWMTPAILLAGTFMLGCGTALSIPAWQASLRDLVPKEQLPSAVTLNSISYNFTRSVGPAIGGILVAAFGTATAFLVNAVSYIPILISLSHWKDEGKADNAPREPLGQAIATGIRYVAMSPHLWLVMARSFLFSFSGVSIIALLPVLTRDTFGMGATAFGLLFGSFGLGAIGGAMNSARLRASLSNEKLARFGSLGFAACIAVIGVSKSIWLAALFLPIAGACWVLTLSLFNTTVQLWTPRWVVGRSMALYQTAVFGGMAAGSWAWGSAASLTDTSSALIYAAASVVVSVLVGLRYPLPLDLFMDLDPASKFKAPALGFELTNTEGPVFIQVDYEIDPDDISAFLSVMQKRRRIRLRDGARRWAIMRDLQNPRIWVESYYVPTWIEYIRHHNRRTNADAMIGQTIRALHRGPTSPKVRRMIERQTVLVQDDWQDKSEWEI
jgi:predicted MFS family arabinose efflux permease